MNKAKRSAWEKSQGKLFKNVTGEGFCVQVLNMFPPCCSTFKPKFTDCFSAAKTSFKITNKSHPGEPGCDLGHYYSRLPF